MNILERAIEYISPEAAVRRESFRQTLALQRKYDAGGNGNRLKGVDRSTRSAAAETIDSLGKLRGFSRNLEENNEYIQQAIKVRANNIIGTGIRPAAFHENKKQEAIAKSLWIEYLESTDCSLTGRMNIYMMMHQAEKAMERDGEVLVVRRYDNDKKSLLPFKIQMLEADYLAEVTKELDSGFIIQGVEYNLMGKIVAYHIHTTHPGQSILSLGYDIKRVPQKDVIHLFDEERPGQVRGVPKGVQCFVKAKDLSEYEDAQLIRQKIASCFVGAITSTNTAGALANSKDRKKERMEPGMFQYLGVGETLEFGSPPRVDGYGEYTKSHVMKIAVAYNVTYESISSDYSNSNFSSSRLGWIESNASFSHTQNMIFIPNFCNRVWGWMIDAGILTGKLRFSVAASWTPPRRQMIDPSKETKAIIEALRAGITSWQEVCRETGWDVEQLKKELAEDAANWDLLKLLPTSDARFDTNRVDPNKSLGKTKK